jgi:hypothetical protein
MKRRIAQLPLHTGKAPPWLFQRMTKLAGAVTMAIVEEFGPAEMLRRLSDPWWFQAFGCALGFDWHSSGVTTVTCGALKEAAKTCGADLGILVAGGKGAVSRKTPREIAEAADRHAITAGEKLIYASRMSAKVDSAAVQDGFDLYHHAFFFTHDGQWCVVQQGMDEANGWARRYHWLAESVDDFVCEPHAAVQDLGNIEETSARSDVGRIDSPSSRPADLPDGLTIRPAVKPALSPSPLLGETPTQAPGRRKGGSPRQLMLLNMVAEEADANRRASSALVRESPAWLLGEIERLTEGPTLFAPARHPVLKLDVNEKRLKAILISAHEQNPQDFERLLGSPGVGPATVRSLSLLAEIIFQAPPSRRDPTANKKAIGVNEAVDNTAEPRRWADYSYTHGGKDGTPFPVNRDVYDRNIAVLTDAVRKARLGENDKFDALRRLSKLSQV